MSNLSTNLLISVIVPTYNSEQLIGDAIKSILSQNYQPLEIIVIDDGSIDNTKTYLQQFDIKYYYQANSGPSKARNLGIKSAQGDLIAFLDADDLWPDHSLLNMSDYLNQQPATEIVLGKVQPFRYQFNNAQKEMILLGETVSSSLFGSGLFRRSVFDKVGLFDEQLRTSEDVDWFLRAKEKSIAIALIDRLTLYYRRHEETLTSNKNIKELKLLNVLKAAMDRRKVAVNQNID